MKRSERICVLLGILAVSCAATFGVMRFEEHKEKIKNSDEIILEISGDSVQSLSWEYESETLAFHKDEKWLYDEDENFPVDEEKIGELLEQFQEFGVSFIIEEPEDFGQYGLDEPICTIELKTEEQSYEILLGNYSNMDSQRYVSIGDGNVYLVKTDPLDYFDATIRDMIDHDEIPLFENPAKIQFAGAETQEIVYEEDSADTCCADDVYFIRQDGNTLPLDTSRVSRYLRNISDLDLTDYVAYDVSDEDLGEYGLDNPELTVSVEYSPEDEEDSSDPFVLHISRDPQERKKAEKAAEDDEDEDEEITAYARVGTSQIVYQISSDSYKELMKASYDSLRHPEVLSADFADVTGVDITLEGAVYSITSKKKGSERIYDYQNEEVEISDFQSALENLSADRFTDEQPTQKEEIGLTVYLDNENFPEIQIALYRYDGSFCLAVVDGEPISLVERAKAVDLMEAVYAIVLGETQEKSNS